MYNFSSEPSGILSLGITSDSGVIKAGLTRTSNMLFSFGSPVKNMPSDFSCAIVNFVGGEPSPILFGSCQGSSDLEDALHDVVMSLRGTKSVDDVESLLDSVGIDYDQQLKQEIEEEIDKHFDKAQEKVESQSLIESKHSDCESKDCSECMYKKYFYENNKNLVFSESVQESEELENPTLEESENKNSGMEFYNEIKSQVDTLFAENKPEEYLQELIPNSKWVKVEVDGGGDYYVFGLIYEDDNLKYVCYGVPGMFSRVPPKQLSGYPVWLAIDKDKQDGFGYWLSYQDASTGESVKAIIE